MNKKNNSPKISVIVPTYNRVGYLKECIESLINQDYPKEDYEIIVVDDGSTDNTQELLENYNDLVRWFKKPNNGTSSARNFGIKKARGEYITTLDSDDIALPNRMKDLVNFLESNKDIAFVHAKEITINKKGERLKNVSPIRHFRKFRDAKKNELTPEYLKKQNYIHAQTTMWRRSIIDKVGLFDEHLLSGEDYDFWLRVSEKNKIEFLDKEVVKYRWHEKCKTREYGKMQQKNKIIIRNKARLRNRFGKDLKLLILTSGTKGGQGQVTTGLAEGLFKAGLTNIAIVKNPRWYEKDFEYHVKELNSGIFLKENNYYDKDWKIYNNFGKLLKEKDICSHDLIHLQCNQYMRELPLIKELNKPIIYSCHSLLKYEQDACDGNHNHANCFNVKVQEASMFASDKIQVMSNAYKKIVKKYYPDLEDRIVIIPNAKNFLPSDNHYVNKSDTPTLLYIARLVMGKGHEYLLESMKDVKKRYPNTKLYLVGDGPLKPKLLDTTKKKGLENNIDFVGWLNHKQLREYYRKAHLFVMATIEENYPLVISEAINFKLPIICSDVGGLQEILEEGECIKVPPKNSSKLSEAILWSLDNADKVKEYADLAYKKFLRKTWYSVARQMLNVYEDMMDRKKTRVAVTSKIS